MVDCQVGNHCYIREPKDSRKGDADPVCYHERRAVQDHHRHGHHSEIQDDVGVQLGSAALQDRKWSEGKLEDDTTHDNFQD